MNTIEKLGITPGPWGIRGLKNDRYIAPVFSGSMSMYSGWFNGCDDLDAQLIAAAPEMLEALIDHAYSNENDWNVLWATSIIEKATGKTWQEIKELIDE